MSLLASFLPIIIVGTFSSAPDIEHLRKNYEKAVADRRTCEHILTVLSNSARTETELAYLGAFQAIWAQHTLNPFSKISTFIKGRKNIDRAAELAPTNVEIISLRYSIQKNCPKFLSYHDNLERDRLFLSNSLAKINQPSLKTFVAKLLNEVNIAVK